MEAPDELANLALVLAAKGAGEMAEAVWLGFDHPCDSLGEVVASPHLDAHGPIRTGVGCLVLKSRGELRYLPAGPDFPELE